MKNSTMKRVSIKHDAGMIDLSHSIRRIKVSVLSVEFANETHGENTMLTVRKASSMLKTRGYRHSPNGTAHFYYKGLNTIIVQQGSEFLNYGKETDKNFIVVFFKRLPDNLNKDDVDAFMAKQLRFKAPSSDETIKEALDAFSYALNNGVRMNEVFDKLEDFEQWLDERERLCQHLEDQFIEYAKNALDKAESRTERRLARKETRWNHILKKRRMERKTLR